MGGRGCAHSVLQNTGVTCAVGPKYLTALGLGSPERSAGNRAGKAKAPFDASWEGILKTHLWLQLLMQSVTE